MSGFTHKESTRMGMEVEEYIAASRDLTDFIAKYFKSLGEIKTSPKVTPGMSFVYH